MLYVVVAILIRKKQSPTGDGNSAIVVASNVLMILIRKKQSPTGDGNILKIAHLTTFDGFELEKSSPRQGKCADRSTADRRQFRIRKKQSPTGDGNCLLALSRVSL